MYIYIYVYIYIYIDPTRPSPYIRMPPGRRSIIFETWSYKVEIICAAVRSTHAQMICEANLISE